MCLNKICPPLKIISGRGEAPMAHGCDATKEIETNLLNTTGFYGLL